VAGQQDGAAAARAAPVAAQLPVARVAVDVPLAHLDRPFDYLVPERLAEPAVPGCRVRVRFAGQLVSGYLLERVSASDHPGRLATLERVISPEPVLSAEVAALAREVADRYAGTLADVLRLAIPPRHARVEAEGGPPGQANAARPSPPPSPMAARRARSGRRCPARTGLRRYRAPPVRQPRQAGGRSSSFPTHET